MNERARILRAADVHVRERGGGVRTTHLITAETVPGAPLVNGITAFEPGAALGFHYHDCDESVLVLEGAGRFDSTGSAEDVRAGDVTFVPAGVAHRFVNTGPGQMRLFFVYLSHAPTRTMVETGETFPIGSVDDVVERPHGN